MDKTCCPLCGAANGCAVQSGGSSKCWCMDVSFSAGLLARVPEDAKLKVCICRACAEAARQVDAALHRS